MRPTLYLVWTIESQEDTDYVSNEYRSLPPTNYSLLDSELCGKYQFLSAFFVLQNSF